MQRGTAAAITSMGYGRDRLGGFQQPLDLPLDQLPTSATLVVVVRRHPVQRRPPREVAGIPPSPCPCKKTVEMLLIFVKIILDAQMRIGSISFGGSRSEKAVESGPWRRFEYQPVVVDQHVL
jgi:hypothetical protein